MRVMAFNWGGLRGAPTVYNCSRHVWNGGYDPFGNYIPPYTHRLKYTVWLQSGTGRASGYC